VDASAGTVGVTMDRRWNSLAMDTSGPEFQRGESAISADGGPSRMDMLAAIQVNPYGWDRAAPAAPRRPQAGWSVEGLQDWWNTPVLPGQRGGMFPSGTDIYGREVTAAPEPFVNALAGAQNIGDSVSAASRGEMGRAYTPDEFQTASGQMMDLAGTAALGTAPAQYATIPGNSLGAFGGRRAVPESNQMVNFANPTESGTAATALNALARDIDATGYYSGALEAAKALKQAKGTPEQMLAQLKAGGAKQNEIEATNLAQFLDGKKSVTRDEIVKHLTENRVGVKEVQYGAADVEQQARDLGWKSATEMAESRGMTLAELKSWQPNKPKWSFHSLDPSNPTYRETVLHLPRTDKDSSSAYNNFTSEMKKKYGADWLRKMTPSEQEHGISLEKAVESSQFTQGHFPEPNIIGHMMTSMTKHEGKPVYTIDQIQSDWGQKLRDGGVRDEAKIAELEAKMEAAKAASVQHMDTGPAILGGRIDTSNPLALSGVIASIKQKAKGTIERAGDPAEFAWVDTHSKLQNAYNMALAEYNTANTSASGNPLVNTTDQWTNTTLRKALMQAADADADYVAIPRGDTVLSYNPGDTDGMRGFYDGIVPKNARNIMQKELGYSPNMLSIDQLETPSGLKGQGFTLMDLPPEIRAKIKRDGMRMFANPAAAGVAPLSQDEPRRYNALAR
jgi:hypothetical protein